MSTDPIPVPPPRSHARYHRRSWAGVLAVGLIGSVAVVSEPGAAQDPPRPAPVGDLKWVEEVVLRPAFADGTSETGTRKWTAAPTLSVMGGTKDQQKLVGEVVRHLNQTLRHTPLNRVEVLGPNDTRATLRVYLLPKSGIASKAAQVGAGRDVVKKITADKWGHYAHLNMDAATNRTIVRGHALVSSDKADAPQLRHNLLWCLCFDLGLTNTSQRNTDSVFFKGGDAEELSDKDRQLIVWFYNHVPAGADSVKKAYDEHWANSAP